MHSYLENWTKGEIEKLNGRRKTIALPSGTIGYRHQNSKLVIDDDEQVMSWARTACPAAIHTTERLGWTEVSEHFTGTGELPDGAHIEPAYERFVISTAKSAAVDAKHADPAIS